MARTRKQTTAAELQEMEQRRARIRDAEAKLKAAQQRLQPAPTPATPGFAIEIKDETNLGLGLLIAEFGDGTYRPIATVTSVNEAREIAESNMRRRMRELDAGGTPMCPERYIVWGVGLEGDYHQAGEILP